MGKDRKKFDESLQETRNKNHDKLRYRKRVQDEEEADKELREFKDHPNRISPLGKKRYEDS